MVEIGVAIIGGAVLLTNTWLAKKAVAQQKTANGHDVGELADLTYLEVRSVNAKLDHHINTRNAHDQ